MSTYAEKIEAIRASRRSGAEEERKLYALKLKHFELSNRKKSPGAPGTIPSDDEIQIIRNRVAAQKQILDGKLRINENLVKDLFDNRGPAELIEEWNDETPIMLLPLRIETKFKTEGTEKELWVRVFPDEIAISTHEETLTAKEVEQAETYWKTLRATADEEEKKKAWSSLTKGFGANRAAWIALQTKPSNWDDAAVGVDQLQFPPHDLTKTHSWTEAPHTRVLPDKFVLLGYRDGELKLSVTGDHIDDVVAVGPAPLGEDGAEPSLDQDSANDNRIVLGPELEWLADFDKAVKIGLGFKIDLNEADPLGASAGYEQLLVVGLKSSADKDDAQELIEDLIQNHHYSRNGFSLVKQGTPTNNTEEKDAPITKPDPMSEESYFVEAEKPLFDETAEPRDSLTDGQRLAEFLGLRYETFHHIANGGARDHTEASAMNSALYAGTLGYFMNSMINDVVDDESLKKLRYHFKKYVTGRGPLAAIRVGKQPYGILVTSSFRDWSNSSGTVSPDDSKDPFLEKMFEILSFIDAEWERILPLLAQIGKTGDSGKNLIEILGLHPNSEEFFQRIGFSYDYLFMLTDFITGGKYSDDTTRMFSEGGAAFRLLEGLGYEPTFKKGAFKPFPFILKLIFQHYVTPLQKTSLIDGLPLSEENEVKFYDEQTSLHYIDWLIQNAGNAEALRKKDFGSVAAPKNLLFLLLLNSMLIESSNTIYKFLLENAVVANELVRSVKFRNITSTPSVSPWEVFRAPVNAIVENTDVTKPFYEYIHAEEFAVPQNSHFAGDLLDQKEALQILKDMPTASLERAMVEHLDTLSYRLDAWQSSLFARRLEEQRNIVEDGANRKPGIYLGAYGYLENVTPGKSRRVRRADDTLPEPLREGKENLYFESGNGGYVHTPSLNHATAAALLRTGYLSHASPEERDMLSVNLSSERVRRAMYLIEGIRSGQTLEVLLGYQFERGLHDSSTRRNDPVILNHLIPSFRLKYPVKKTKVPQAGKVTGPEEIIDDFHVVNGLKLAETTDAAPYISENLTQKEIDSIAKEKNNIQNTLDALRDVLTAESAYQLSLGNFDRAAAVVRSLADGTLPPDIQVIETPRSTALSLTNRVVVHFDSTINTAPPGWTDAPINLQALTEPGINHWVGAALGDPEKIRCRVKAVDKEGNVLTDGTGNIEGTVTLKDLALQPIDLLFLARKKTEEFGTSELETRIRYVFAQLKNLSDDTIVKIEFSNNGETDPTADLTIKSFAEILPFVDAMRNTVSGSRAAHARDYTPAAREVTAATDNPENINLTDLKTRVEFVFDELVSKFDALKTARDIAGTLNELRESIKAVADTGFEMAFPFSAVGFGAPETESLLAQADSLLKRFDELQIDYATKLLIVEDAATGTSEKISLLIELSKLLLGDDFTILPRFSFVNKSDVADSHADADQLLAFAAAANGDSLVMDEWLYGVSLVRPKMRIFETMRVFYDALNQDFLKYQPLQLPYRENASWLAVEYPEETAIDSDTLCFAVYAPQGFDASLEQCALIIDDWTEVVPEKEEVTGLTFNYNQPNTVPPQAVLLAVTPRISGSWQWENLIGTIRDTFRRAKLRAVEPDHLDVNISIINKFLPALMSEISTGANGFSLDLALLAPTIAYEVESFYTES